MNAIVASPVDQVSDHSPIMVKMEATFIQRRQTPQQEAELVDPRSRP